MKAKQNSPTMSNYLGVIFFLIMTQFFMICTPTAKNNAQPPQKIVRGLYKKPKKEKKPVVTVQRDPAKDLLLKKTVRDMNLEELQAAKDYSLKLKDLDGAIKFIERMIMTTKDQKQLCSLRLEIADTYFEKGTMKKSGKKYSEYIQFYPGSPHSDYAEYKGILSRFYARLQPPLDQQKTRKTIRLAQHYLDLPDTQKRAYVEDIKKIQHTCYQDLYVHERGIFECYCKLNQLTGAQTHLTLIKNDLLPYMKEIEPELIECEILIAQQQKNSILVAEKTQHLEKMFPTYVPLKLAANTKTKKSNANRF